MPSSPAVARRVPSGLQSSSQTSPEWPGIVNPSSPVAPSQRRAVPSPSAVAIHRPSGLHARSLIESPSPHTALKSTFPVVASATVAVAPSPPKATRFPSGLNAVLEGSSARTSTTVRFVARSMTRTASGQAAANRVPSGLNDGPHTPTSRSARPPGRWISSSFSPVSGAHTRTAPSSPDVASIEPSSLNVTSLTSSSCPRNERIDAPVLASRMSTRPDSSGPSVTNTDPSGLQSSPPPTSGTLRTTRDAVTARCRASTASGSASAPCDRVSSIAARASSMLRSGSSGMLATAAAASSRAEATRRSCSAWRRWSSAMKPPTRATTRATAMAARCQRSRRLARACRAIASASSRRSRSRASLLVSRNSRSGSGRSACSRPALSRVISRRAPRYSDPGSRPSSTQVRAASRKRPRAMIASRSSSIQDRRRGHSRSRASWASSTVGTRVRGSRSSVRSRACAHWSITASTLRSAPRPDSSVRAARRRVGSPSVPTTTSRSNIRRTASGSPSSSEE